jgi:hypothetical protein
VRKYAVCLDTLGQDREFTQKERLFALQTVMNFAKIWEKREKENLTRDRNFRLQMIELDKDYNENWLPKLSEEEDDLFKEHIQNINYLDSNKASQQVLNTENSGDTDSRAQTPAQKHPYSRMDEEQKDMYHKAMRLKIQAQQFKTCEYFKAGFKIFRESTVIKYVRVWQSLFYLLGTPRDQICEMETNKLKWKYAKNQIEPLGQMVERLVNFEAQGHKTASYPYYHTLNFLEKNIEQYYPEDIDAYNVSILGRLLKWMHALIKLRKSDIVRRKALQKKAKDQREEAISKEAKRKDRMV